MYASKSAIITKAITSLTRTPEISQLCRFASKDSNKHKPKLHSGAPVSQSSSKGQLGQKELTEKGSVEDQPTKKTGHISEKTENLAEKKKKGEKVDLPKEKKKKK
uniref:Uncharacterized protein n=1 Tax=Acrobeloides nanus TaxID=290746 RepID=A0A914DM76_9BILA